MVEVKVTKTVTMKFKLSARASDHRLMVQGECNNPRNCRWNVATYRAIPGATKVWVDAGHIKFTLNGWRWSADTPKQIKADLILLDKWVRLPKKIRDQTPPPFDGRVYTVVATRLKRAHKATREELDKMSRRRFARLARGELDKPTRSYTFHDRIVGYA